MQNANLFMCWIVYPFLIWIFVGWFLIFIGLFGPLTLVTMSRMKPINPPSSESHVATYVIAESSGYDVLPCSLVRVFSCSVACVHVGDSWRFSTHSLSLSLSLSYSSSLQCNGCNTCQYRSLLFAPGGSRWNTGDYRRSSLRLSLSLSLSLSLFLSFSSYCIHLTHQITIHQNLSFPERIFSNGEVSKRRQAT